MDHIVCTRRPEPAEERRARRLAAFAPPVRPLVRGLIESSGAIEDLADSFPALLFAIATGYGTPEQRARARSSVEQGAALRTAAEALGLPWWLRRLPATAFTKPLGLVPGDPHFSERIAALLPAQPASAAVWLAAVLHGYRACHADYALWIAGWAGRQPRLVTRPESAGMLGFLAAWAWHASAPGTPGHALLRRPWTPQIGVRRALDEVTLWRRRLALDLHVGSTPIPDWLADGEAMGYAFRGLRTAADYVAESEAMDNCLDQFADRLEGRRSHVFSISRGDRRVADVEIGVADIDSGMPSILQLRGPRNRRAGPEVWQAAYAWLGGQSLRPLGFAPAELGSEKARRAARTLWQPYLSAIADKAIVQELALVLAGELGLDPATLIRSAGRRRPPPARAPPSPASRPAAPPVRRRSTS